MVKINLDYLDKYVAVFPEATNSITQISDSEIRIEFSLWKYIQAIGKEHNKITGELIDGKNLITLSLELLNKIANKITSNMVTGKITCTFSKGDSFLKDLAYSNVESSIHFT